MYDIVFIIYIYCELIMYIVNDTYIYIIVYQYQYIYIYIIFYIHRYKYPYFNTINLII